MRASRHRCRRRNTRLRTRRAANGVGQRRLGVGCRRFHAGTAAMHDHSSRLVTSVQPPEASDLLTRVLLGLRLDGVEYGRCVMREPWAIAFPAQRDARFHFVARGQAWLWTPSTEWKPLHPGDAVLLPRGSFHIMASSPDVPAVDIDQLAREAVSDNLYLVRTEQAGDAADDASVMFCG